MIDPTLIVAATRDGVIGRDGRLPWHLPGDLKRFRATTWGHPIVMGRRTHESIGRPLPGRVNIILSRRGEKVAAGCELAGDWESARDRAASLAEATGAWFVIGGAEAYRLAWPIARQLDLTLIEEAIPGDTFFPVPIGPILRSWRTIREEPGPAGESPAHRFLLLERPGVDQA